MIMDQSSNSNPNEAVVKHLDWAVNVDFEREVLSAEATYTVSIIDPSVELIKICLDSSALRIQSVKSKDGKPLNYTLHPLDNEKSYLGQKLEIAAPAADQKKETKVVIAYETTEGCSALQWLPPSQTAGKKCPYLFSQCQAIHARSLVPCQDQCGIKMTYNAIVTCPSWATCVMSALLKKTETKGDSKVYTWNQPVPISSYLLALAVGDIVKKEMSHRCAIWSEPSLVDAAAHEFAETEQFLTAAEDLSGKKYVWGRYDLLCLPPSFPFGGMENPCKFCIRRTLHFIVSCLVSSSHQEGLFVSSFKGLTFVTPTLLAGDRSLADVVAHEIAHSWTGNLVTNATWDHFWLNEGWTTWFQRKIMVAIKNNPKFLDFDAIDGRKHLMDAIEEMQPNNTRLVLDIGDADPDDSYSAVAYEKGFTLLLYLERMVGTGAFEGFFKAYISKFASKTLTSGDFKDFFLNHFEGRNSEVKNIDWETWFHGIGEPPVLPPLDQSMAIDSNNLATLWFDVDRSGKAPPKESTIQSWSSLQITCFLDALQVKTGNKSMKASTMVTMNNLYHFSDSRNSEILFRYCMIAIPAEDSTILPVAVRFITTQGRMKFTRPIYKALYKSRMGKALAVSTFLENKDVYHPICSKMVAQDLKVGQGSSSSSIISRPFVMASIAAVVGAVAFAWIRRR